MTKQHSISPLRQRMLDDMTMRKLNPKTQAGYLRAVKNFSRFFDRSPDLAEPEDLRRFQLHMVEKGVTAIVVVAGMEGTLPSLVSSLVDVPVVGVPTSIGYGVGLKGAGALMTMLQTCSPKLAVVNIDNGFGAGIFAASIARQSKRG